MTHCYAIVYRRCKEGFSAHVPDLPDCQVYGATLAEAEQKVQMAVQHRLACVLGPTQIGINPAPATVQKFAVTPHKPALPLLTACAR